MIRIKLCLTIVIIAISRGAAWATPILDQSYDPAATNANAGIGQSNVVDWAQTFSVGVTGTLTSFDVKIRKDGVGGVVDPLLWDLRTTTGGVPIDDDVGVNILASGSVSAASISTTTDFFSVDISGFGVTVTTGEELAIVLRSDDPINSAYRWAGTTVEGYADGAAFDRIFAGDWGSGFAQDLAFKTFVEPVPEPSSLVLAVIGLAGLLAHRAWRRRLVRA